MKVSLQTVEAVCLQEVLNSLKRDSSTWRFLGEQAGSGKLATSSTHGWESGEVTAGWLLSA